MTTGQLVVPNAQALSEFAGNYTGDCVETSVLAVEHVMVGAPFTPAALNAMVLRWQSWGGADSQGRTNGSPVLQELNNAGIPADNYDASQYDWRPILRQYAGTRPIIVGLDNAQALGGWNAGVHGHAIVVMGQDSAGYIVMDPNSQAAQDGAFVHYTEAQLDNAGVAGVAMPRSAPASGGVLQSAPVSWLAAVLGLSAPQQPQTMGGPSAPALDPSSPIPLPAQIAIALGVQSGFAASGAIQTAENDIKQATVSAAAYYTALAIRAGVIFVGVALVIVALVLFAKPSAPSREELESLAPLLAV